MATYDGMRGVSDGELYLFYVWCHRLTLTWWDKVSEMATYDGLRGASRGELYLFYVWCHRLTLTWWDHEVAKEIDCNGWRERMASARKESR